MIISTAMPSVPTLVNQAFAADSAGRKLEMRISTMKPKIAMRWALTLVLIGSSASRASMWPSMFRTLDISTRKINLQPRQKSVMMMSAVII